MFVLFDNITGETLSKYSAAGFEWDNAIDDIKDSGALVFDPTKFHPFVLRSTVEAAKKRIETDFRDRGMIDEEIDFKIFEVHAVETVEYLSVPIP